MTGQHSRRSFIARALATGAIMEVPFLARARRAQAAPVANVIFVFVPDGIVPSLWHPRGGETDFTLPAMSQPLDAIRQSCVFLEGVSMHGGEPTHPGGTKKVLTATGPQSLDVFLGQKIKGSAPFEAVQLGVQSNFENGSGSVSFIGLGQEVKPDDNPLNVFARLFGGGGTPPGGANPGTPGGGPVIPSGNAAKKSILDAIRGDLTALQTRLGAAEKGRLDLHLQALRDVELRTNAMAMPTPGGGGAPGPGGAVAACNTKAFNSGGFVIPANDAGYPRTFHKPENFTTVGNLQQELAVLALSCGLTRVITLMWSHAVSPTKVPGLGTTVGNHDASHYGVNAMGENARQFTLYRRFFMERTVALVNALKNTPGPEGSLFDNTVLFLCSDIADGDLHDHRSLPFVVIGGSKTGLRGGRALNFTGKGMGRQNETHAKILVSIANAAGVPIDSFGYTAMGTGGLPGLFV